MTAHVALENLSALLDGELAAGEREAVHEHLESCLDCRRRLDGLRAVARGLGALERLPPPPTLDLAVARRARARRAPGNAGLRPVEALQLLTPLALPFAAVAALAAMLFVLAAGREALDLPTPAAGAPAALRQVPVEIHLDGRVLRREPREWREAGAPASGWREATATERGALAARHPRLAALAAAEPVVLRLGDEWLRFAPVAPATAPLAQAR